MLLLPKTFLLLYLLLLSASFIPLGMAARELRGGGLGYPRPMPNTAPYNRSNCKRKYYQCRGSPPVP